MALKTDVDRIQKHHESFYWKLFYHTVTNPKRVVGACDFVYSLLLYWLMNTVMTRLGSLEKLAQLGDRLDLRLNQPASI